MRLFGFEVTRTKTSGMDLVTTFPSDFPGQGYNYTGWFSAIRESFSGAWQRNIVATSEDAMGHPTFWACVTLIAGDIAKCGFSLFKEQANGITLPVDNPAFSPVLRKPNHYQHRIQFYTAWVLSLLTRGNAYILKERDNRKVVTALYVLDATRVRPMVTPDGDVYYSLGEETLPGVGYGVVVPASEIIHDRMNAVYHDLCGLSPVYAAGQSTLQSLKVMSNATRLAQQSFRPGGVVTSALPLSDDNVKKFEAMWDAQYAGPDNIGKVVFLAGGLKFEKPPVMSAVDAQVIDQLKWNDEKICSVFHVPPYMVGVGPAPTYNNIEALNQQYYSQGLQVLTASMELCLEEGLGVLETGYGINFERDALILMDSATKMKNVTDGIKGGVYTPNEGRLIHNKPPLKGGDTVYLQEQDHALEWLAERDAQGPPPQVAVTAVPMPAEKPALPPAKDVGSVSARDTAVLLKAIVARKKADRAA